MTLYSSYHLGQVVEAAQSPPFLFCTLPKMEVMELHPLSRSEVIGNNSAFLGSAFQGEVPKPVETLIGDDPLGVALGGGCLEALKKKNPNRQRQWYRSYVEAIA